MIRPHECAVDWASSKAGGMRYDRKQHHRRSIRLAGHDYAQAGAYFVTMCMEGRRSLFGCVAADIMQLNAMGRAVERCWHEIPVHYPEVVLDDFIVMPNHVHGILVIVGANHDSPLSAITDHRSRFQIGANDDSPLPPGDGPVTRPQGTSRTIGSIVRGFKTGVAKWMRENAGMRDVWQRNYYEHVIRGEVSLNRIRRYIQENPMRWAFDRENPLASNPQTDDPW